MTYGRDIKFTEKPLLLTIDNAYLLNSFSCGNEVMDEHIRNSANDLATVTKMFVDTDNDSVVCVYSLSCSSMIIESGEKHYPAPAVEIKTFAVDTTYQNIPYSEDYEDGVLSDWIFSVVIGEILSFTDDICGANLVLLYSTDEGEQFYRRNGFMDFIETAWRDNDRYLDGCTPLYLRIR